VSSYNGNGASVANGPGGTNAQTGPSSLIIDGTRLQPQHQLRDE